jgi:hypothetical protein
MADCAPLPAASPLPWSSWLGGTPAREKASEPESERWKAQESTNKRLEDKVGRAVALLEELLRSQDGFYRRTSHGEGEPRARPSSISASYCRSVFRGSERVVSHRPSEPDADGSRQASKRSEEGGQEEIPAATFGALRAAARSRSPMGGGPLRSSIMPLDQKRLGGAVRSIVASSAPPPQAVFHQTPDHQHRERTRQRSPQIARQWEARLDGSGARSSQGRLPLGPMLRRQASRFTLAATEKLQRQRTAARLGALGDSTKALQRASGASRNSEGAANEKTINAAFQDTQLASEVFQLQSAAMEAAWIAAHGSTWKSLATLQRAKSRAAAAAANTFGWLMRGCDRWLPMLRPNGWIRQLWSTLLLLLVVYTAVVPPLHVAFDDLFGPSGGEGARAAFITYIAIDVLFIVDLLVNFRTAFVRVRATAAHRQSEPARACAKLR